MQKIQRFHSKEFFVIQFFSEKVYGFIKIGMGQTVLLEKVTNSTFASPTICKNSSYSPKCQLLNISGNVLDEVDCKKEFRFDPSKVPTDKTSSLKVICSASNLKPGSEEKLRWYFYVENIGRKFSLS